MSRVDNQRRLFLELTEELRPWWRRDPGLPQRLNAWLARHRSGSRDRRLYRELAYTSWRILPWIEDASPDRIIEQVAQFAAPSKATSSFIEAYKTSESITVPAPADSLLPDWLSRECPAALGPLQRDALLRRAPLWIRLQTAQPHSVAAELNDLGIAHHPSGLNNFADAWRIDGEPNLLTTRSHVRGHFEIQDIGSQALLTSLADRPQGRWLDACAGAGGKTLQLARLLGPHGHVTAQDVRGEALREFEKRADRAGLTNVEVERVPDGQFDGVLLDAPCSGSGTWRRSPHLKWTTTPATLQRAAEKQHFVLDTFAPRVAPGGLLVYATCSLCHSENAAVIESFLETHPEFRAVPLRHPSTGTEIPTGQLSLLPADLDSDGYFVACLRRT
ncbi:MAG: RsmB/NOP family class I SAM-dependent RNA methyltransferase [Candidatus Synoicihabitans palmerolidicus]|nr:RsmB/NOP family class I SAM-dependent RNA methyltransferase [Candidatus Synoicihabitans palmerolidicus]